MTLSGKQMVLAVLCLFLLGVLGYWYRSPIGETLSFLYRLLTDREQTKEFVHSFGMGAPLVFIMIQIAQVIFAPVPGEATGFIGGYLFGVPLGFLFSTVGLTAGSMINFFIGRFFGERYVRKWISPHRLRKLDRAVKHQGGVVIFIFFIFPGFPKDYLCLLLGLSSLPFRIFILLAGIGRMPGTLMLSLQGSLLFERSYGWLALMTAVCGILVFITYRYREMLYQWSDRSNNNLTDE